MTPLAQTILKDLALPASRREFADNARILPRLTEAHCFECSEIIDPARDLAFALHGQPDQAATYAFLPAPCTWIEFWEENKRVGVLLDGRADKYPQMARVDFAISSGSTPGGILWLSDEVAKGTRGGTIIAEKRTAAMDWIIYALLAMINTPRVIGRRQHMPHAGLQRALAKSRGMIGKFPLHAWTEIKLEVTPPRDESASEPREAMLTGHRALHFCRAHLRIRMGRLELVKAHWRGDPALGIKRSRYTVTMPAGHR